MPWKDPLRKKEYMKEYSARPDQIANRAQYQKDHPEVNAKAQKTWANKDPANAMIVKSRSAAKKRGLEFTVKREDLSWPDFCPVLGIKLNYTEKGNRRDDYPSLDRWDNEKGYVPGNVYVISWRANRLKLDATVEEVEALLRYMKDPPITPS